MASRETNSNVALDTLLRRVLGVLAVIGILVTVGSHYIPVALNGQQKGYLELIRLTLRELGVVVLATCIVGLIYEVFLSEKIADKLREDVRILFETADANAAVCSRLGILEIYQKLSDYHGKHPLANLVEHASAGLTLRIVGLSLFGISAQIPSLEKALERGANIQLCYVNPSNVTKEFTDLTTVRTFDIQASKSQFADVAVPWLKEQKPKGTLELRQCSISILDSYFRYESDTDDNESEKRTAWNVSFGRGPDDKHCFLMDSNGILGKHLKARYDVIWNSASKVLVFEGGEIKLDQLSVADALG